MLAIEYINITEIKPSTKNARLHNDEHVEQIISSIKEFGFTNPILIDENNVIIAGHGRFEAMKRTFSDTIPCVRLCSLTEIQKNAYMLADNKIALNSSWDISALNDAINALDAEGFDLTIAGFIEDDIKKLTEEIAKSFESGEKEHVFKEVDFSDNFSLLIYFENEKQLMACEKEYSEKGFLCKIIQ